MHTIRSLYNQKFYDVTMATTKSFMIISRDGRINPFRVAAVSASDEGRLKTSRLKTSRLKTSAPKSDRCSVR